MYFKVAEKDNKVAGFWQKDANGILVSVSLRVCALYIFPCA